MVKRWDDPDHEPCFEARELDKVRRRLSRLIGMRQMTPLSPAEETEYEQLSQWEAELLERDWPGTSWDTDAGGR
jgi:hypothetical protein